MNIYISKNYTNKSNAGNKAKTDIECILANLGYTNVGLKQSASSNKVIGFILTLCGVIKAAFTMKQGDRLVLQYPLKKYYTLLCCIAHLKGAKVITIIHDLGCFRRKKLTSEQEMKRLDHSDGIVSHNTHMTAWLKQQHAKAEIHELQIFDYLSQKVPTAKNHASNPPHTWSVMYAGALAKRKNAYLYEVGDYISSFRLYIYGSGLEEDKLVHPEHLVYKGFVPSDELINKAEADFGLVWEGESISTCKGDFGDYIRYNNPHKVSLYIRCQLPIIIWSEAALASFVEQEHIGICISSLKELDDALNNITNESYLQMKANVERISGRLASGYYTQQALASFSF